MKCHHLILSATILGIFSVNCSFGQELWYPDSLKEKSILVDTVISDSSYMRIVNRVYNDIYVKNSEIGFVTLGGQAGGPDDIILSGNIVPHYYILPTHWRLAATITPQVRVRILQGRSFPVRTPSFQPAVTFFYRLSNNLNRMPYLALSVVHHSNGQDGPPLRSGEVNTRNGSFQTNYLEIAFYKAFTDDPIRYSKSGTNKAIVKADDFQYFKVGLELHSGLIDALDEPELRSQFGQLRLNFRFYTTFFKKSVLSIFKPKNLLKSKTSFQEVFKFGLEARIILKEMKDASLSNYFNIESKFYFKIPSIRNSALFASVGYLGQDYYNIYFKDNYFITRVGFAAGSNFFSN